jgi:hypothetical protein
LVKLNNFICKKPKKNDRNNSSTGASGAKHDRKNTKKKGRKVVYLLKFKIFL